MTIRSCFSRLAAGAACSTALFAAEPVSVPLADQLGLQLYSVRGAFLQDPFAAMDMVAGYGIKEVETAGTARMTPEQFRAELEKRGLRAVSAHVQYGDLAKDFAAVLAEVKTLGATYAIVPWIPHDGEFDRDELAAALSHFREWGDAFAAEGIAFGYHPHGYELGAGLKAGETMLDELIQGTADHHVKMEMDVFWIIRGGADPVTLLRRYPDRWVALHVKDMRKGATRDGSPSSAPATDKVVVGSGSVDWKDVIGVARSIGVTHFFVEDESPDPLANIPLSFDYLKGLNLNAN